MPHRQLSVPVADPTQRRALAVLDRIAREDPHADQARAVAAATAEPLWKRIRTLLGDRILATHPYEARARQLDRQGSLYLPASARRVKHNVDTLYAATVLKLGTAVPTDELAVGDQVIVSQFAGATLYDVDETGRETAIWLFSYYMDVQLVLEPLA